MDKSTLTVFQAINAGQPVPKRDIDAAIKTLEEMLPEARERGAEWYVSRIQESIERARQYKRIRGLKPRSLSEIQKDVEGAQLLIDDYRMYRKYELAARWEKNRDEYQKEYREAISGRPYVPEIEEADENAAKTWIPEGFQMVL